MKILVITITLRIKKLEQFLSYINTLLLNLSKIIQYIYILIHKKLKNIFITNLTPNFIYIYIYKLKKNNAMDLYSHCTIQLLKLFCF